MKTKENTVFRVFNVKIGENVILPKVGEEFWLPGLKQFKSAGLTAGCQGVMTEQHGSYLFITIWSKQLANLYINMALTLRLCNALMPTMPLTNSIS